MADAQEVVIRSDDGTEHVFPPGFDPKRAASIVRQQAVPVTGAHPEATIGPAQSRFGRFVRQVTDAVGPPLKGDEMPGQNAVGPQDRTLATSPLLHLTGVDAIDGLTSPANVALTMISGGKPVVQAAYQKLAGMLASVEPGLATEIVGLMSPRAAHGLKVLAKVGQAAAARAEAPVPAPRGTVPPPEMPSPPAAPSGGLNDALAARPRPAPVVEAPPVEAPPVASARPTLQEALAARQKPAPRAPRADSTAESSAPPAPSATTARPTIGRLKLSGAEVTEYSRLRKLGKSDTDAATAILTMREMAAQLGLPSSADVASAVRTRNATGRWQ